MKVKELVFLTANNPLYEDYSHHYSRLKFYADTLVKLAKSFGCSKLSILYQYTNIKSGYSHKHIDEDDELLKRLYEERLEDFENCDYVRKSCESFRLSLTITRLSNYYGSDLSQSLVVFGILNDYEKSLNDLLIDYEPIIKGSLGYLYLSSDAELSSHQYIESGRIGFLSKLGESDSDSTYTRKLKGVILTEITDPDILDKYKEIGVDEEYIYYLPMVINFDNYNIEGIDRRLDGRNNRIMILRNYDKWKEYPELFESVKDHFDIYESSMPVIRKRYIDDITKYGGVYKNARYWVSQKMISILSWYKYYLGMSTPGSDRFTYKIVESTMAGTICVLPKICLNSIGYGESFSEKLLRSYDDIFIIDPSSDKSLRESLKLVKNIFAINDSEYVNRYDRQLEFMIKYFDYSSSNVNTCINIIKKGLGIE